MIDPPNGWRYGFPKEYTPRENQTANEWLVECGYPQEAIDEMGEYFYVRQWDIHTGENIGKEN